MQPTLSRRDWVLSCLAVVGVTSVVKADEPRRDAFTAKEILDKVAKTYAELKTYRDSGEVTQVFMMEGQENRIVVKPFKTAFVRPERFRFEYSDASPNGQENVYIICRAAGETQSYWDVLGGIKKEESLRMAIASATGVSSGSAYNVPTLLLNAEFKAGSIVNSKDLKRIEDDKLDGVDCYRIESTTPQGLRIFWIEQKTFLLRVVEGRSVFANFRVEETTRYKPVVDGPIDDKLLEFNPPKPTK